MRPSINENTPLPPINYELHLFPYCIVWASIPILSWICPLFGHMGIGMSNGVIRDFSGHYYIGEGRMGFNWPIRYLRLHPSSNQRLGWDEGIIRATMVYRKRMHHLCFNNCHSYVATALNYMHYKGCSYWNMFVLIFWIFIFGRYVGFRGFLKTWVPFLLAIMLCVLFVASLYGLIQLIELYKSNKN